MLKGTILTEADLPDLPKTAEDSEEERAVLERPKVPVYLAADTARCPFCHGFLIVSFQGYRCGCK